MIFLHWTQIADICRLKAFENIALNQRFVSSWFLKFPNYATLIENAPKSFEEASGAEFRKLNGGLHLCIHTTFSYFGARKTNMSAMFYCVWRYYTTCMGNRIGKYELLTNQIDHIRHALLPWEPLIVDMYSKLTPESEHQTAVTGLPIFGFVICILFVSTLHAYSCSINKNPWSRSVVDLLTVQLTNR